MLAFFFLTFVTCSFIYQHFHLLCLSHSHVQYACSKFTYELKTMITVKCSSFIHVPRALSLSLSSNQCSSPTQKLFQRGCKPYNTKNLHLVSRVLKWYVISSVDTLQQILMNKTWIFLIRRQRNTKKQMSSHRVSFVCLFVCFLLIPTRDVEDSSPLRIPTIPNRD